MAWYDICQYRSNMRSVSTNRCISKFISFIIILIYTNSDKKTIEREKKLNHQLIQGKIKKTFVEEN